MLIDTVGWQMTFAITCAMQTAGGLILIPENLGELDDILPDRSVTEIDVQRAGLWDTPIVFLVLILLLAFEWTVRRVLRLA